MHNGVPGGIITHYALRITHYALKMTDFSTPRRMGASAFMIMFLKNGRKLVGAFFAAIVILFSKTGTTLLLTY